MNERKELLEKLAAVEHEQWSEWIRHMESLKVIVDVPIREMWLKLACIPYGKLTETGKESDRKFARKVLKVFDETLADKVSRRRRSKT